jgi:hypothetical protein
VAQRGQEGEGHGPADEDPVGRTEQAAERAELIRHLGAAEHHQVRPPDVGGEPGERGHLGLDQVAGRVRQALGDVVDAGVLAVHGAEAIRHVQVCQPGELVG